MRGDDPVFIKAHNGQLVNVKYIAGLSVLLAGGYKGYDLGESSHVLIAREHPDPPSSPENLNIIWHGTEEECVRFQRQILNDIGARTIVFGHGTR